MQEIKDRLQQFLLEHSITAAQLADTIGVQRSSLSHILSGRNKPSLDFLEKLISKYKQIDITWLLLGGANNSKTSTFKEEDNQLQLSFVNSGDILKDETLAKYEKNTEKHTTTQNSIENSLTKQVVKIVWFYNDGTFEEFKPTS